MKKLIIIGLIVCLFLVNAGCVETEDVREPITINSEEFNNLCADIDKDPCFTAPKDEYLECSDESIKILKNKYGINDIQFTDLWESCFSKKQEDIKECSDDEFLYGDYGCMSFENKPVEKTFYYIQKGGKDDRFPAKLKEIKFTMYSGLNKYFSQLVDEKYLTRTNKMYRDLMREPKQEEYLTKFIDKIREESNDEDEQVRIAVSIVQNLGYKDARYPKHPYEVLYTKEGSSFEKSTLMAYLLKELDYGVVLFEFKEPLEGYMTVGIKCPKRYSYKETGYCFIEPQKPSVMTDSKSYMISTIENINGTLHMDEEYTSLSDMSIINIADGKSFDAIEEEWNDAGMNYNYRVMKYGLGKSIADWD